MARKLTLKERWKSWPTSTKVVVVVLLSVALLGCQSRPVVRQGVSSCDLHITIPQGSGGIPLRVVYAVQDHSTADLVHEVCAGTNETWRRGVRNTDVQ